MTIRGNGRDAIAVMALFIGNAIGCSNLPAPPQRPSLDPNDSAEQALAECDANGDGQIDAAEATKSPGLVDAFARVDENKDNQISADEIADRIRYYKTAKTTIVSGALKVMLDGRPLVGATVTLEPEPFLGSAFTPCTGQTDETGQAVLTGHDAKYPGIYLGMYRVRISRQVKGKEMVPARYNTETTLGYEAADDIQNIMNVPHFDLKK